MIIKYLLIPILIPLQINALSDISPVKQQENIFIDNQTASETKLFLQSPTDTPIDHNEDLEACGFMSFEEWKKTKIESNITNDTIININQTTPPINKTIEIQNFTEIEGKLYKDKFNFASIDCAATIVKTNSQAKGASAILKENKDSYLLNECSIYHKYVIIELCQDILISQIVMGNFEFFSSMFKDLNFEISDRFPTNNWKSLGNFKAENKRDLQVFNIMNPLIWARYLKIEILSHYDNEFYCPISIVRVHGKTMMDEFKEEKVEEQPKQIVDESIFINETLEDECKILLPHLRLNEFLKDLNQTKDFCLPNDSTSTLSTITTQESIYKNIMKRLSLLESNATLSLLYIEEQSKLLSNAFSNLEKKQVNNFNNLINSVNLTLFSQITTFKENFNNLNIQYLNLFKLQESNYKSFWSNSNQKVVHLTQELNFQRKLVIFNSLIIIFLLVYVVITRDINIEIDKTQSSVLISSPFRRKK
ncbi:unnamed protein product [Candida verbasci]|uniref:SUN-like protein 1 n=1 Tax=Candida verbasci TaxID=1227364 RepID=A0A9W4XCA6_9ASCO|nr:unnamed protein product [Candida verbasci]